MKNKFKYLKNKIINFIAALYIIQSNLSVYATSTGNVDLDNSIIVTGSKKFIKDATSVLLVFLPLAGAAVALYFWIRKSGADDQDQKTWNKRLITCGISVVGGTVTVAMINVLVSYFK